LGPYTIHAEGTFDNGETQGFLGPGLFDRRTARLLGIRRRTVAGDASLYLDTYDSYPDPSRTAQAFGYIVIAASVPEPSTLVLLGMAAALYGRRRIRAN
jgi:hypothetical protein